MSKISFGFLGGGQMATAIAKGAVFSNLAAPSEIGFFDTSEKQTALLREKFPGCTVFASAEDLFRNCQRIILAVKPQTLAAVAAGLSSFVSRDHLIVSIAAGVPTTKLIGQTLPANHFRVLAGLLLRNQLLQTTAYGARIFSPR